MFRVAQAMKTTAYPPDRARVLRVMRRSARYVAACAADEAARGDRVVPHSLCFYESISHAVQLVWVRGTDFEIVEPRNELGLVRIVERFSTTLHLAVLP